MDAQKALKVVEKAAYATLELAKRQGLTLVHISAQPEHFLRIFDTETSGLISQKVLKSI